MLGNLSETRLGGPQKESGRGRGKEGAEREAGVAAEGQQAGGQVATEAAASQVLTNKPDRRLPAGRAY